jgi:predicted DNA-binding transcriptional regulator AlpA
MRKLVNTKQAAETLGLKPNTLEIWRCHNKGPKYKKLGRRILYDLADLEEFAASCTVETRPISGRRIWADERQR